MKKFLVLLVAILLCLPLMIGCGKDGTDNPTTPNNPDNPVTDPEGTITLAVRNWDNGRTTAIADGCNGFFAIRGDNNFAGGSQSYEAIWSFATIGQVYGVGSIKKIPTNGFSHWAAVKPGYGYVAKCINQKWENGEWVVVDTAHVRIYVDAWINSATTGGVMGATIKYQSPFVP